ncbi:hypothetical protein ACET3X_009972 [Alternaria dauci]|uniref:Uncharacterized protein n=1 Tax=Alternaria dauci TaxID=48095 RepID=A0ABR3U6V0_9PLEO
MAGSNGRKSRLNFAGLMRATSQSFPTPQEIESQKWNDALESSQRAVEKSMDTQTYQRMVSHIKPLWDEEAKGLQRSSSGIVRGDGVRTTVQSPSSDTTVKLGNGYKGRHGGYSQTPVPEAAAIASKGEYDRFSRNACPETPLSRRTDAPGGGSTESPRQPHPGGPGHTYAKPATHSASIDWWYEQDKNPQGSLHLGANFSAPGFQARRHQPTLSNQRVSPEDLHTPHRAQSYDSKQGDTLSSLPSISSPWRPGHVKEQPPKTNGGAAPLRSVPYENLRRFYEMGWQSPPETIAQMTEANLRKRDTSSPTVQPYASTGSISPTFDIRPRSALIDDDGTIFIHGFGHARKYADPFVDSEPIWFDSPSTRSPIARPTTHTQLPSQPPMQLPPTPVSAAWHTSVPVNAGSTHRPTPVSASPFSAASVSATPLTPVFRNSASVPTPRDRPPARSDFRSLPPPLSSIDGKYHHTPDARARLEAQKPVREEWILTGVARIRQLARLSQSNYNLWLQTRSELAYKNWQKAEAALLEATDTETKKEERRNLFLNPKGMTALKTDKAEDMSADSRVNGIAPGEKKLLGYQMATMERVCAEVKRDKGDDIITAEMLATLSMDEKKALRKHLLGRLERS